MEGMVLQKLTLSRVDDLFRSKLNLFGKKGSKFRKISGDHFKKKIEGINVA